MDIALKFIDLFLHLDQYISTVLQMFGGWTYLIVFLVVFCETGLVVTPILPGDSLLFGLGTFAAKGDLNPWLLVMLLSLAAVIGDSVNYAIGRYLGPKVFQRADGYFFKKAYLDRTHEFYEKHGGKTIIIARFIPIIRTFAPFVAGIGNMTYGHFISYNIVGGIAWVVIFVLGGYYFGNLPFVKQNFTFVIIAIIILSVLPGIVEYIRQSRQRT